MWKFVVLTIFIAGASAVPAYSSAGAAAGASSGTGSGYYPSSSKYGSGYGSQYPYVGGYASNYVGGYAAPLIYPVVPPFAPFGFNNDLQHFINSYFNAIQSNVASAASATGSISPGGVYQTASIYPSSVSSPNVVVSRFGSGGPGFQGVSTYASSDSSGNRQAYTSVNDNGRVTTYHTQG